MGAAPLPKPPPARTGLLRYLGAGVACTVLGSAIGTAIILAIYLSLFPRAWGIAVVIAVYGLILGSLFAAPVALMVMPLVHRLTMRARHPSWEMAGAGAVSGFVSPLVICIHLGVFDELPAVLLTFAVSGAASGALIAPVFLRLARPPPLVLVRADIPEVVASEGRVFPR